MNKKFAENRQIKKAKNCRKCAKRIFSNFAFFGVGGRGTVSLPSPFAHVYTVQCTSTRILIVRIVPTNMQSVPGSLHRVHPFERRVRFGRHLSLLRQSPAQAAAQPADVVHRRIHGLRQQVRPGRRAQEQDQRLRQAQGGTQSGTQQAIFAI